MKRLLLLGLLLAAVPGFAQFTRLPAEAPEVFPVDVRRVPADAVWGLTTPLHQPRRGPLLVVDGHALPDSADLPLPDDIIGLRELEPGEAVRRYGQRASRGALLIETAKRNRWLKRP
ncbi:hypothetical protein [Hymenobacter jeollabukensis]|uniref:TonB-dependent receptor plug domain-containing protein n=1 Tax=Hymenobacter jeollabukensis TaxID=2025313 RepID=A0A5R8WWM3_9BACT|nr:hypothetical protein [Hymenobacter jeollabukensis]TLM96632.1 hypothetical protein FDY95_01150 [Hymenobacter jeollabukensis]